MEKHEHKQPWKYNEKLIPFSRELRKEMTAAEKHLWYDFLKTHPMNFSRQKVLGHYIADFYCAKARLVIELDGKQHYTEEGLEKDIDRTEYLNSHGIRVLRFKNGEIKYHFKRSCERINCALEEIIEK